MSATYLVHEFSHETLKEAYFQKAFGHTPLTRPIGTDRWLSVEGTRFDKRMVLRNFEMPYRTADPRFHDQGASFSHLPIKAYEPLARAICGLAPLVGERERVQVVEGAKSAIVDTLDEALDLFRHGSLVYKGSAGRIIFGTHGPEKRTGLLSITFGYRQVDDLNLHNLMAAEDIIRS